MSRDEGRTAAGEGRAEGPSEEDLRRHSPRPTGGREVRIGLFVLVGIASVLVILFLFTDPAMFRGQYMVTTEMEHAGGVRQGDAVQMRGVPIGQVRDFAMVPEGVEIVLRVDDRWEIPEDSRARLAGAGVLEGRTIEIVPGDSPVALEPGGRIPGEAREGVMGLAEDLGEQASDVMGRVDHLLDEPTVSSLQGSVRQLEELLAVLAEASRQQQDEVARLIETLNRSAEGLEEASRGGEDVARAAAQADSALMELRTTGRTLDQVAGSMETVAGRVERGEGTLGRLSRDDELYEQLLATTRSIEELALDVQENPQRYIRLRIF